MAALPRRPPGARLDGDRVRQLREQKELTQLYIAEVVGVSVDTVSRWENNRTQAIRADNLRALAEALEVPAEAITLGDGAPAPAPGGSRRALVWGRVAAAAAAAVALGWWLWGSPAVQVGATRRLPAYTAPGTAVPVVVRARVTAGEVGRVVLREQLPAGWEFLGAVPAPDQGPDETGRVRWIVPVVDGRATVAYVVRAPDGPESSAYRFAGQVVTPGKDGRHLAVGGEARIDLEYIHWADEDGDFQVGDGEVLDALERIEAAAGLGVDSADLRRLWGADEYQWDPATRAFRPLPPTPPRRGTPAPPAGPG